MNQQVSFFQKHQWALFIATLVLVDAFMLGAGFYIAYMIRFNLNAAIFIPNTFGDKAYYQLLTVILSAVWLVVSAVRGLYSRNNLLGGTEEYAMVFRTATLAILVGVAMEYTTDQIFIARGWLLLSWFLNFFLVALGRFLLRRVVYFLRKKGLFLDPIVIVGANAEGILMGRQLSNSAASGFRLVGYVDNKFPVNTEILPSIFCMGRVSRLDFIVKTHGVREVILATSAFSSRDHMIDIFNLYGMDREVRVRFSSGLYETITTGLSIREFSYVPLVEVNQGRLKGPDKAMKTALEYLLILVSAVITIPICLILAFLVKLDSPGPAIYRRRVLGTAGKEFDAFKFRTMYVNGDEILNQHPDLVEELNQNQKLKDDPRVTKIGRILRQLSLDELPQLLNVLRGEMAIVGPRMITAAEIENYKNWGMNMLTVLPGITGLWQISGRSDLSYEERVRLDLFYIRNWSIWLDLRVLIQTVPAVLRRKGAY